MVDIYNITLQWLKSMTTKNPYQFPINLSQLSNNRPLWNWWQHLVMITFMLILLINVSIYSPLTSMEKGISLWGCSPWLNSPWGFSPVYMPLIFLCVYKPMITLSPLIWIISPPFFKGYHFDATLKSYHSFFPCDNFSPWKHASMLSLQAFTFAYDKSLPLCHRWQRYLSIWGCSH